MGVRVRVRARVCLPVTGLCKHRASRVRIRVTVRVRVSVRVSVRVN